MRHTDGIYGIERSTGDILWKLGGTKTEDSLRVMGDPHGDDLFENGGFIVHFFDDALLRELSDGFELVQVVPFNEGELPRQLWRVTMRKTD